MLVSHEYHKVLKTFRKNAQMTQEEIADELNVTQSCVSKLESGRKIIDIDTFVTWASVTNSEFQDSLEDLIYGFSTTKRRNQQFTKSS